ncbi:hypothetical protein ACQPZG_31720 [Streptomyces sp. CA-294286]|uniref:hypothetical protein n=1 Tax=Streptomyces sp. CA-294286 TaxID=3240070 RepID=UPI003D8F3FBE
MTAFVEEGAAGYLVRRLDELAGDFPVSARSVLPGVLLDHIGLLAAHLVYAAEWARARSDADTLPPVPGSLDPFLEATDGITRALTLLGKAAAQVAPDTRPSAGRLYEGVLRAPSPEQAALLYVQAREVLGATVARLRKTSRGTLPERRSGPARLHVRLAETPFRTAPPSPRVR